MFLFRHAVCIYWNVNEARKLKQAPEGNKHTDKNLFPDHQTK